MADVNVKSAQWKVGDWVIFDMKIGQIKELRDGGFQDFSDGMFRTSGRLAERFRPLTLENKNIAEGMEYYYKQLREIDGEAGFNYPDISSYFSQLALDAIDAGPNGNANIPFEKAQQFVRDAREHKSVIQGISLFRRNLRRHRQS